MEEELEFDHDVATDVVKTLPTAAHVTAAVAAAKAGEVQYRAEKAGVVHAGIGKASFDEGKIL